MTHHFQSIHRTGDIAGKVIIKGYSFSTDDEELAAFARRNCKPGVFWEIEAIVAQAKEVQKQEPKQEPREKRRPGRPKVIAGMRTQDVAEGVQV